MKKVILAGMIFVLISCFSVCRADFEDYAIRQLTFDGADHNSVSVSASGKVIWTQYVDGYRQVFSLDEGRLTFDSCDHATPDINSRGEIVYLNEKEGTEPQVYSNVRGRISDGKEVSDPRISDTGEIIWKERYGTGHIFHSNIRQKITDRYSYEADIIYDGEVVYTGNTGSGEVELFSLSEGQSTSGFSGSKPRANNHREIVWEHDVREGDKIYRQIFSNINKAVTDFYGSGVISMGDIDDDGIVYFTKEQNGRRQIFSAIPKRLITAEAYETPDREMFDKIDKLLNAAQLDLEIISPEDGAAVNGYVRILTNAEKYNFGYVYAIIDAEHTYWDYSEPYNLAIDTTTLPNGTYTVEVHSWHKQAERSVCDKVTLHINN